MNSLSSPRIEYHKSKKRKRSCSHEYPSSEASSLDPKAKKEIFQVNHDDYTWEKYISIHRNDALLGRSSRRRIHEKENKHSSKIIETQDIKKYAKTKHEHILDFDKILHLVLRDGKLSVYQKKKPRLANGLAKNSRPDEAYSANKKVVHKSKMSREIQYCEKGKKQRNKTNKSKAISDLYNIDNFVVQSNSLKIVEKTIPGFNIPVPRYQELDEEEDEKYCAKDSSQSDSEDITDELYLKYHNQYENREREYRQKYCIPFKKKNGEKAARNSEAAQEISHTQASEITSLKIKIELDRSIPSFNEKNGDDMILI